MNKENKKYDTCRINSIPIVSVARRLGQVSRAGSIYKTRCPWHEDTHPSLALYENTKENHCHCFACGKGGNVINFVKQQQGWDFKEACQWLSSEYGIPTLQHGRPAPLPKPKPVSVVKPVEPEYTYIPSEILESMISTENSLCRCLIGYFPPEAVEWVTEEYCIGVYGIKDKDDCTVFPSIDAQGRICNLKVQHYETDRKSPQFAHCDKDLCFWLGTILARQGLLPKNAKFKTACLFGEHLLPKWPSMKVALVESPKNAILGALSSPRLLWVATGNKGALKREVLRALKGRDVIVMPDADAVEEWTKLIKDMADIANFTVSDFCRRNAPEDQPKFDIADFILQTPTSEHALVTKE